MDSSSDQLSFVPNPSVPLKERTMGTNGCGLQGPTPRSSVPGALGTNGNERERTESNRKVSSAGEETVLALDLGTTTGWALRTADGQTVSGTQSFKPGRFEGGGMRFLRFRAWLSEVAVSAGRVQAVYFEEVRRHAGVDAAHVYGGLMATLTAWCEAQGIAYAGVPVGTIKKHAPGQGNADKAAMVEAMRARGHAPQDDNEADALALLHLALQGPLAGMSASATRAGTAVAPRRHPPSIDHGSTAAADKAAGQAPNQG